MNFFMEVAKLRAARLLWAELMQPFEPQEGRFADAAHALPDLGRVADRAGPVQQHRPHRLSRRWRRCSAARSRCTPTRSTRRSRCRRDVSARIARNTQLILPARDRRHPGRRSAGRQLLRREPDREPDRRGAQADRRGRGAGRHDQGGRGRHAQAAHRGGGGAPPGAHRPRRGGHRRRQQVPARRTRRRSTSSMSTTTRCASRRSRGCERSAPDRDEAKCVAALTALGDAARNGDGNLLALRSRRRARAPRSARSPTRWKASSAATRPRSARSPASMAGRVRGRRRASRASSAEIAGLRRGRRPPAAHAGRQAGPGRPRPRRQGDRHGLRRYRLRRRYRPAVPDAGGGRARRRSRTTCMSIGVSSQAAGHKTLVPQLIEALREAGRPRHPGRGAAASSRRRTTTS